MGRNSMLNAGFKSYCVICAHMGIFPKSGHIYSIVLNDTHVYMHGSNCVAMHTNYHMCIDYSKSISNINKI